MKTTKKSGLFAAGLAGAVMLMAPAAFAASTVSVDDSTSPAGNVSVTGTNMGAVSFNTTGSIPFSCLVSSVSGKISRGASATVGTVIGQIDNLSFGTAGTPCTLTALNLPILLEKNTASAPLAWDIELATTPAKGSITTPIVIREVSLNLHSTGSLPWVVDLKAEGDIAGAFNQVTQQITISTPPAFPLDFTTFDGTGTQTPAPNTFLGMITHTNFASMVGSFTLATPGGGGIHW